MQVTKTLIDGLGNVFSNSAKGLAIVASLSQDKCADSETKASLEQAFYLLDGADASHWVSIKRIIKALDVDITELGRVNFTEDDMSNWADGSVPVDKEHGQDIKVELDKMVSASISESKEPGSTPTPV